MNSKYKDRWVLNEQTGNVKHWNPNMIGVEYMVECDADGVPLELSKRMDDYKTKVRAEIKAEMNGKTDGASIVPEPEVGETGEADDGEEEYDPTIQSQEEKELNTQRLMTLTKAQLIAMARQKGMKFSSSDENKAKLWFAEKIVDFEWQIRQ